ncbi:MAG: metalloregulator ArsR/SmtB family transcription factor [Alphaproteobacteria bacterium]|nr:metalloregulator ArsR/SmtB family transcription factor [Alphaproteobacteria bacterium]
MDITTAIEALAALSQPTRLRAFRLLVKSGPSGLPAGEIAAKERVPHNTMSTHLNVLTRARLVHWKREGRSIIYTADLDRIRGLLSYLVSDCCDGRPEVCAPLIEIAQQACCPPRKRALPKVAARSAERRPATVASR